MLAAIMRKILFTIIYLLILTDTIGQISSYRQEFFRQEIETIISENKKYNAKIIISDERIKWDTTHWTIKSYFTKLDTIDDYGFEERKKPTEEIIKKFYEVDFQVFKEQIINQHTDSFIKQKIIKGDRGSDEFNKLLTIKFSQPLVSQNGNFIIIKKKIDSQYCFTDVIWIYKKINSKWTKAFEISNRELCE